MLKAKLWIGVVSAPVLFASAGCAINQYPQTALHRGLPPERLMSMAKTFERQGHLSQAKYAYYQVLAAKPDYPNAQQSLESLIALESRQNQARYGQMANNPNLYPNQVTSSGGLGVAQQSMAPVSKPAAPPASSMTRPNVTTANETTTNAVTTNVVTANSADSVATTDRNSNKSNSSPVHQPENIDQTLPQPPVQVSVPLVQPPLKEAGQPIVNSPTDQPAPASVALPQVTLPQAAAQSVNVAPLTSLRLGVSNLSTTVMPPSPVAPQAVEFPSLNSFVPPQPGLVQTELKQPSTASQDLPPSPAIRLEAPTAFELPPSPEVFPTSDISKSTEFEPVASTLPPVLVVPPSFVAMRTTSKVTPISNETLTAEELNQVEPAIAEPHFSAKLPHRDGSTKHIAAPKAVTRKLTTAPELPAAPMAIETESNFGPVATIVREPIAMATPKSTDEEDFQIPTPIFDSTSPIDYLLKNEQDQEDAPSQAYELELQQFEIVELRQFFGTFEIEMVEILKTHRDRFQGSLLELVADHSREHDVRSRAIFLLGSIGPEADESIPVLRHELLTERDLYLRVDLAEAVLKIQPEDSDAINTLVDALSATDQNLRWASAFSLRNAVSPRTTFVVDRLKDLLGTDDAKLKRMVILTLGEFGPAAARVIPQLEAALQSPDRATRDVAEASLACIDPNRKASKKAETPLRLSELNPEK